MTRPMRELSAIVAGVATRVLEVDGDGPAIRRCRSMTRPRLTCGYVR
jgi:hypothetical protein